MHDYVRWNWMRMSSYQSRGLQSNVVLESRGSAVNVGQSTLLCGVIHLSLVEVEAQIQ